MVKMGSGDSGCCSLAEVSPGDPVGGDEGKLEERIQDIFDSLGLEEEEETEGKQVKLSNQDGGQQQGGREARKRRGVSGYLQEWAGWRGGGEEGSKSLPPVPALQGEDLWAFWDQAQVLIEWNTGG